MELHVVGQRHARRLDHDPVRVDALAQPLERLHELVRELAADAAAAELDERLVTAAEQRAVDAELAELVRHDREAQALRARVGEQVAHERGLARAQKPGNEQHGDAPLEL